MTPDQVSHAVSEGLIENNVHLFYEAAKKETGNKHSCPKSNKVAWRMFCESLKDKPLPNNH